VLKFSKQADKKNQRQLKGMWRRYINKRKNIIRRNTIQPVKPKPSKKFDFALATKEEKAELNAWLDSQGIKR